MASTQESLARIRARDPAVKAWAYVNDEAAEAPPRPGPLSGIPIGIKDMILTADMPTRYNTDLPDHERSGVDAACVAVLRQAGAVIIGKTHTVEFGTVGRHAPTRNPHDLSRTPGGSSSGSAAAVADGQVPLALGTQTGGSIIRPASFCGVYGFKPSWGLVGNEGAKSFAPSFDTIGWFARSIEDISLLADVYDLPHAAATPGPFNIAVCRTPMWDRATPSTQAALAHAVQAFRDAGAAVTDMELPAAFAGLHDAHLTIMRAEGGRTFLSAYRTHGDDLHPNLREMVRDLDTPDHGRLRRAHDLAAACRTAFDDIAGPYDAVLAPSTTGEAPDASLGTGDYVFNGMWTLLHAPCLNLPLYTTPADLPVGVTLTGPRYSDRMVIGCARALS